MVVRGFNEALNGFTDEGWTLIGNDGMDDVTILVNSSPEKLMGLNLPFMNGFTSVCNAVLCAKASMLLQVSNNILCYAISCGLYVLEIHDFCCEIKLRNFSELKKRKKTNLFSSFIPECPACNTS